MSMKYLTKISGWKNIAGGCVQKSFYKFFSFLKTIAKLFNLVNSLVLMYNPWSLKVFLL